MGYFFTGDPHFNHSNIIQYCNRPFKDVTEMNETIIQNWNDVVGVNDTTYIIGDLGLGNHTAIQKILKRLNGKIEFIFGNHDKAASKIFHPRRFMLDIVIEKQPITLCHYAMRVWNKSHFGAWHLYGHSHGQLEEPYGLSFDVGVDNQNFTPISFEEVKARMEKILEMNSKRDLRILEMKERRESKRK